MSRRRRTGDAPAQEAGGGSDPPTAAEVDGPPIARPALAIALLVAAGCVALAASLRIPDYDLWRHLATGKAIWQTHGVPGTQVWSWPHHGAPAVLTTWGFSALLWPFWSAAGETGFLAWRWLVALAAFAALWRAARQAGSRGLSPLIVLVLVSLVARIEMRGPAALAGLLLALELWTLETRRGRRANPESARGLDPGWWVIPIVWAWVNVHDTYWLGLVVLLAHLLDAGVARWRSQARPPVAPASAVPVRTLVWIGLGAIAVSFLNPFGWRLPWQPFDFLMNLRHEPIVSALREHQPVVWTDQWRSGLPLLVLGWPLLLVWRALRARADVVEILLFATFLGLTLAAQRYAGFFAIAAGPYVARGLDEWVRSRPWPAWTARPYARAALVAIACVAVGLPEWTRPGRALGTTIEMDRFPVGACDFMAKHGVRGRGFVPTTLGGYVTWRFWPERERLPFLEEPLGGTAADRGLYAYAFSTPGAWQELDRRYRFDYALLEGRQESDPGNRLLDVLDADTTWSLVFRDDAAALYVRRGTAPDTTLSGLSYLLVPGGDARIPLLVRACQADTTIRRLTEQELRRMIDGSPRSGRAHSLLGTVAWIDRRPDDARRYLEAALAADPRTPGAHQRLGLMALSEGRPEEAVRHFRRELALGQGSGELAYFLGRGYQRLGERGKAREWYRRAFDLDPRNLAARESLAVLERAESVRSAEP
jgi:tetratricopeptide (TPR) repeat protein